VEKKTMKTPKKKLGYRVARSTIVLAESSKAITDIESEELRDVLAAVHRVNFDFGRLPDDSLEVVFAHFDEDFTDRVKGEFEFEPDDPTAVKVHDTREAICVLCGKGNSKDTGDNVDQIRFEFRLTNTAGGDDLWVGSTCILNFGLKVRGADTAEEARKLLEQSCRNALKLWKIRQWQAAHPTHAEIPAQYERLCDIARTAAYTAYRYGSELRVLGVNPNTWSDSKDLLRRFKTSTRFYQRSGHLTPKKMAPWDEAAKLLRDHSGLDAALRQYEQLPPKARFDYLVMLAREVEEKAWADPIVTAPGDDLIESVRTARGGV
jgi:hypothetical protein